MNSKKLLAILMACALVLLGAAAYAASDIDPDTLRVAEMWEIDGLDPAKEGTFAKEKALIVETLLDAAPDFSLVPGLAESWELLSDTQWVFTLRSGVVFHNGDPLTSKEVCWSLKRAMDVNPLVKELTRLVSVEPDGPSKVILTTSEFNPALPASLVHADTAIIHPDSTMNGQGIVIHPLGTGPYSLTEWKEAQHEVALSRNDAYWGEMPSIKTILYRSIPDPATRSLEVQKGSVDFIADAPYGDLDMLREKNLNVTIASTARVYELNFGSIVDTPFADVRVRKALSYAINREEIVQYVLFGMGEPGAGPYNPGMVFCNDQLKPHPCDPEQAKALLAEAGWTDSDGDGVVDKDGAKLSLTLYTYSQRPGLKPMAMAVQQMWAAIGVHADVRILDWSAIVDAMQPGDIRLAAFASAMIPDPDYFFRRMYAKEGDYNTWGYENPQVDGLLAQALKETDPAKRLDLYKQAQLLAYEDTPVIFVSYYGVNIITNPKVKGFVFNPVAHDFMLNTGMRIEP